MKNESRLIGFGEAIASVTGELSRFRWQAWLDFRKDLSASARAALAGNLWNFLLPIVPLSVYLFIGWIDVFPPTRGIAGLVYVAVGATLWLLFSSTITATASALASKGGAAVRSGYPLPVVVASAFLQVLFEFSIRAAGCVIVMLLVQLPDAAGIFLALPLLLMAMLLFVGASLIIGIFAVAALDVQRLIPIVLQYSFFLSFVLFPLPRHPITDIIYVVNPFAVFIDAIRQMLMTGNINNIGSVTFWSIAGVLIFVVSIRFMKNAETKIREVL